MNINLINIRSSVGANYKEFDKELKELKECLFEKGDFSQNSGDLPVFFIESGGSEGIFKSLYKSYKEPYIIISKPTSNSLPAALEICSFLNQHNLNYIHVHDKIENIPTKLINALQEDRIENKKINSLPDVLKNKRYGVIGKPSDWLIASEVNYTNAKNKLGVTLLDISFDEFLNEIKLSKNIKCDESFLKYANDIINEDEIFKAYVIYSALKKIVKKYELDGITVRCFDLLNTYKSTSCLALAILNSEGITSACEGDAATMLTMAFVKALFNKETFQVNPSYINLEENYGYFAHCTIPLNMCKSFKFDTHYESQIGIGIKGEMFLDDVTVLKINNDFSKIEIFEGNIVSNLNESNLCRTQIKIKFKENIVSMVSDPLSNHLVIVYGSYKKDLQSLFKI